MKAVISYGGGLDSFRMLLLAVERHDHIDAVVFEDVADPDHKDPGEWPSTYRHIREVAMPLCHRHGIPFVWLDTVRYPVRGARSLFAWFEGERGPGKARANIQIPVCGPSRICTTVAKVERFEKWLNDTYPGEDVEVWVGFEAGEEKRAAKDPNAGKRRRKLRPTDARRHNRFPLMEAGLCRCRCERDVRERGYPVPRKSACTFCPYGTPRDWKTLARELPEQFDRVVALEAAKPPTSNGIKLSIMGYRVVKNAQGEVVRRVTPMLPTFVEKPYRPRDMTCGVCGGPRATKATGCSFLGEEAPTAKAC